MKGLKVGVIVLSCTKNRLVDLKPLMPKVVEALKSEIAGKVVRV